MLACEGEGAKLDAHGAELCQFNDLQPSKVLENLAARGVNRVLLECGPHLAAAFLAEACVDDIALFEAPHEVAMSGESDISRWGWPRRAKAVSIAWTARFLTPTVSVFGGARLKKR